MLCSLDKDINKCPFFNNEKCINKEVCSFQVLEEKTNFSHKYVRKERWYDKYYKKKKPIRKFYL